MRGTEAALSIDDYISKQEKEVRPLLEEIRKTIRAAAPQSKEVISYGMPAFRQNAVLVYFAACKNHIGFYPTASGIRMFNEEWKDFKTSKGAVQLQFNRPLPVKLIGRVVKFRIKEDAEKVKNRKPKL